MKKVTKLTTVQVDTLLETLKERFLKNIPRHKGMKWEKVEAKLRKSPKKLTSLFMMEDTGGEPDVIAYNKKTDEFLFCDCAAETPSGRRSMCYDQKALKARKEHPPEHAVVETAKLMGVELLSEADYRALQKLGDFDTKTSSWVATPEAIRKLGGALFCDKRYNHVFVYHNGADSYYGARAFRGKLSV